MFRVGQKVVCINDDPHFVVRVAGRLSDVRKGEVYTVARTGCTHWMAHSVPCILLAEQRREDPYAACRFRPLVDISDLEAIVSEVKQGKPRTVAPDKFDKQVIHSSRASSPARPCALSPSPAQEQPAAHALGSPAPLPSWRVSEHVSSLKGATLSAPKLPAAGAV